MKFEKSLFDYWGGYLVYGPDREFIARFKYRGAPVKASDFKRLLIKYFTVEQYFELAKTKAPLQILMDAGLVTIDEKNQKVLVAK